MKSEKEIKKEIRTIDTVGWSDEEYEFMARRDEDLLNIREFTSLKLHNTIRPLKKKMEEGQKLIREYEEQLQMNKAEIQKLRQMYEDEKRSQTVNSGDNQKLYYELADTKALLQQANFKRDNYDRAKFERDDFERKLSDCEARVASLKATLQVVNKERDDLNRNVRLRAFVCGCGVNVYLVACIFGLGKMFLFIRIYFMCVVV